MTGRSVSGRTVLQTIWPAVPLIMALGLITIMLMLVSQHSPLAVYMGRCGKAHSKMPGVHSTHWRSGYRCCCARPGCW
jgi:hypothetical protein